MKTKIFTLKINSSVWYLFIEHLCTNWFLYNPFCSLAPICSSKQRYVYLLSSNHFLSHLTSTPNSSLAHEAVPGLGPLFSSQSWLLTSGLGSFSQFPKLTKPPPSACVFPGSAWLIPVCPSGLRGNARSSERNFLSDPLKNCIFFHRKLFFSFYSAYNYIHIFICICILKSLSPPQKSKL